MKKLLLVLLLLAPSVMGADYLETFKQYRFAVRQAFNVDTSTTSGVVFRDTTMNDLIRRNAVRYVMALRCIPYTQGFITTYKQGRYALDSLILGITSVEIVLDRDDSVKTLSPMPRAGWYQSKVVGSAEAREFEHRSSYYDSDGDYLWLYPVPMVAGGGDSVKVYGWRKIPSIAAVDSLVLIPQEYRPIIFTAVCYDVARATSNPNTGLWLMELNAMRTEFGLPPIGGQSATGQ